MRRKTLFAFVAVLVLNIIPLMFSPALIIHFKTIILCIAAATLWLSQPVFSNAEMQHNRQSDKFSILLILIMSSLCVAGSVTEWAYFNRHISAMNVFTYIGLGLLCTGIALRLWSIQTLGKHFTATVRLHDNHSLITYGPYRYVRHPSYLGAFIAIAGCPLFLNNWITVYFCPAAMIVAYWYRINHEEKKMLQYFGNDYRTYQRSTFRMLPYIW